jgi:fumarate hydratase subunit alpha
MQEVEIMRKIKRSNLVEAIEKMIIDANINLDIKMVLRLQLAMEKETSPIAKNILSEILENQEIARDQSIPMCQDTGVAVFFIELGNGIFLDFDLEEAVNEGVRNAYKKGYLRKSVVNHPLDRKNTMDNTPAVIHIKQVQSEELLIRMAAKGAGSENMSAMKMLVPSDGKNGIINFVLKTIKEAGGKACPPIIVGLGIGGNFEKVTELAKEAIFRDLDDEATNSLDRELEKELLEKINLLDIGPMGLRGQTTCIAVKVNSFACHIASLPVAVNIQCHAARHKEIILRGEQL